MPADFFNTGERKARFQVHYPNLSGIFQRNRKNIGIRRADDHAGIRGNLFAVGIDTFQFKRFQWFQGIGVKNIVALCGTNEPAMRYLPSREIPMPGPL